MRIGILGGTFDPIHSGHLEMAETAIRVASLDSVYFVTSVNPPHKGDRTEANFLDRHAMVALALRGRPKMLPCSMEFDRSGKSYSIDTVLQFQKLVGESSQIFFLIGLDAFLELRTWKDFQRFPELCSFLVFRRPGYAEESSKQGLPEAFALRKVTLDQQGEAIGLLERGVFLVPGFLNSSSSTEIRERLRKRLPVAPWVPAEVEEYIAKTRLYLN